MILAVAVAASACSGDDGDGSGDVDAAPGVDAPACTLPSATTTCTVGDDSPCTALCATAYCHNFGQLPNPVCTQACTPGSTDECPSGWTCNNMGRCRPPG
ncbi:MAG TPA: hypothetical protein VM734_04695 [Kofleriaceae bacterium]|nr:hypothetical protein [Kofleriaceae bacterium]